MMIQNTTVESRHPWPDGILVQGGSSGLVFRKTGGAYNTAFVEAFPDNTFIRGEGASVEEAEDAAWAKYQRDLGCPGHEWEARGYRNGCGFCKHCNRFGSGVFDLAEIGSVCDVCGVGTYWAMAGGKLWCEKHAPSREERRRIDAEANTRPGPLEALFDALTDDDDDDDDDDDE